MNPCDPSSNEIQDEKIGTISNPPHYRYNDQGPYSNRVSVQYVKVQMDLEKPSGTRVKASHRSSANEKYLYDIDEYKWQKIENEDGTPVNEPPLPGVWEKIPIKSGGKRYNRHTRRRRSRKNKRSATKGKRKGKRKTYSF
jgi:hypothetical protein